jgi:hypothetical protein
MDTLRTDPRSGELDALVASLSDHPQADLIAKTLRLLLSLAEQPDRSRLDWKILHYTLQDMEQAMRAFAPYQHRRKVAVFGSARVSAETTIYQQAVEFSRQMRELGFMVLTGAGGGIMEAGNRGAGTEESFGLNIYLPFEQGANPYIEGDAKLIEFRYFFTRKLFFVRESHGIALFPGGLGTQDECFETLTLMQTGKSPILPLVLVDQPGGEYWRSWERHMRDHLLGQGLISPEDVHLYWITDDVAAAAEHIARFWRVYHSSRYVGSRLVIRLNQPLSDDFVEGLSDQFSDILSTGRIVKSAALPGEEKDETYLLPRLVLFFNRFNFGRLRQLIDAINAYQSPQLAPAEPSHCQDNACQLDLA